MTADERGPDRRLSRRRLLRLGTAGAAVAVAGCLGDDDEDDPANGDGNGTTNPDDEEDPDDNPDDEDDNDDNTDEETEYVEFNTELETMVQLRGAVVATGSIDTQELHEWAVDDERPGLPLAESGEVGGHTIYEADVEDGSATLGINENNIVFGGNRSTTEGVIQTIRGQQERGHETFEEYAWLLSAVGDGGFVYGGFLPESEQSGEGGEGPRRSANGYAVTMERAGEETEIRFAATYPELTEGLQDQIRAELGQDAETREVAFGDGRAFVRATYSDDLIAALDGADSDAAVTIGDGGDPTTSEGSVPAADTATLPRVSEYVAVQNGLASGSTIDEGPFRTLEDGSLDALDSEDVLLVEPVRRTVELHNNLGQVLFGNFTYLFRIIFDITEVSN